MELDSTIQISSEQLQSQKFDVIIAVSGYESRCTYLVNKINVADIPVKIVLALNDKKDILSRKINDERFNSLGFRFVEVPLYNNATYKELFDSVCIDNSSSSLNILVDYSAMPKVWYSAIINYFMELEDSFSQVNVFFSYSPSEYNKAQSNASNKFFDEDLPQIKKDKPIILFLGLGYERGNSEELSKLINARTTFAYYANPAIDDRFVRDVLENNQNLLRKIQQENLIQYPIHDLNSINHSLTSLCINLRMENHLVLAPIGPKPFTLMCFILAARYPDIKIWKVKRKGDSPVYERKAHGELLVYKLLYTSEEVDYDS